MLATLQKQRLLKSLFFVYLRAFLSDPLFILCCTMEHQHYSNTPFKLYNKYASLVNALEQLPKQILIFHLEGALLKSSSLFPYFMLVAFEAGGPLRALILLISYAFVCLVSKDLGLKIMVFVCFAGIRKDKLRVGSAVLPKFFLEDVCCEGFDIVMSCKGKVAVTDLPRVMVEGFLKDYLEVDSVVGRELKVVGSYYVGLMEEKKAGWAALSSFLPEDKKGGRVIGIGCSSKFVNQQLFAYCKEVYLVTKEEKRRWEMLPKERYPKPLIFHDGRLAFRPTPFDTLVLFIWLPFGILLSIFRVTVATLLPFNISIPILALTGTRCIVSRPSSSFTTATTKETKQRGLLYVCNHRTLLDPIYISFSLKKPVSAVTYSMSKFNELVSPIRTARLTRDRVVDRKLMEKMLSQGDLVVCPEGTTCREPYLLRFSPLFAEITEEIVPVAIAVQVSMFYGSTASGLKCLDPLFHLLNPFPAYSVKILEKLPTLHAFDAGGQSSFEFANHVQSKIAAALGFKCTSLTRKDKYMILAGNDGII